MLKFVLAGAKGIGKSSIFSRIMPQNVSITQSQSYVPPALFSLVTLDFPSPTFSDLTQQDSIPQVISSASGIIYCLKDPDDNNLSQLCNILQSCGLKPNIFVLLHQVDKLPKDQQSESLSELKNKCNELGISENNCYATSLFDGSLTKAFTGIINCLLPNFNEIKQKIVMLSKSFNGSRVILVDNASFLPICDSESNGNTVQLQPIFDFYLKSYAKQNPMKTFKFECDSNVIVFQKISKTTGIFVSSTFENITTDAILFNIKRIKPSLKEFVKY